MWINGRDPVDDGWTLVEPLGRWLAAPSVQRNAVPVPQLAAVSPSASQTVGARTLSTKWSCTLSAITSRDAALLTLQDRTRGLCWLRFNDAPTRVVRAVVSAFTPMPVDPNASFSVPSLDVQIDWLCYDGASYDTEPLILALATTPTEIALGSLPSPAIVRWGGTWAVSTARTFIVRDVGGQARYTMTVTTPSGDSLSSTDHLEMDLGRRYLTKVTSAGVRTNALAAGWTVSLWPVLDSTYQDRANTRYLTAEISAGTAQITYRKAYGL